MWNRAISTGMAPRSSRLLHHAGLMTEIASAPTPKPPARGPLISADDALARLLAAVVPSGRTETVATPEA